MVWSEVNAAGLEDTRWLPLGVDLRVGGVMMSLTRAEARLTGPCNSEDLRSLELRGEPMKDLAGLVMVKTVLESPSG